MHRLLLFVLLAAFCLTDGHSQNKIYKIEFQHFEDSRGDSSMDMIAELPRSEYIQFEMPMNVSSGLGPTFNYHGYVVIIDQISFQEDGSYNVLLRREDGKDFFGYYPTLRAILKPSSNFTSPVD